MYKWYLLTDRAELEGRLRSHPNLAFPIHSHGDPSPYVGVFCTGPEPATRRLGGKICTIRAELYWARA